ncbi:MAG: FG-GAP-like repeat-containing protein [Bryobacteraceae bacterium]
MKEQRSIINFTRREFLISAAAVPALTCLPGAPAFADESRHNPPYLAIERFIPPGNDEFPEEEAALQIVESLEKALRSMELPVGRSFEGSSPCPKSYRKLASDLEEAVFEPSDTAVAEGWKRWVQSLGRIRRTQFYVLPDGIVRYEVASEQDGKLVYRVGQWKQSWDGDKLVALSPFEEHVASAAKPYFRDVTTAAFEKTSRAEEQLSHGIPYWRARLDPATGIDIYGSNGIAVGDLDNDGLDEMYVCQPGGLPNRLFKFHPDGSVSDITDAWGVGLLDDTSMALFLDLRNVGRQDLIVLRSGGPVLFLNEVTRFRLRTDAFRFATSPTGAFTGMAAADFDCDGKLDLYLCCYVYFQSEAQYTYASPYHDAQNGPPNYLFRNQLDEHGSGFLEDCTAETGINQNNNRFSFAPAWCDFNDDGWPDLYVANDFGRKNFYVNNKGQFRDVAKSAGVEDIGPGMSACWFDYDNDGKPDLYVANMWTAAGQRITGDKNFAPAGSDSLKEAYRQHTMGNSLFHNRGDGTFEETTLAQHVNFGRWAWASGGHDLDNDGVEEIFITCGMLTNTSTTDLNSFFWRQVVARSPATQAPSAAYENGWNALNQFIREDYSWNGREPNVLHVRRGDRYFDFSGVSGLDYSEDSRTFAITDFDGDGRPDIILKSRIGPQVRILQNDCAESNRSIAFRLQGTKSNRDGVGARIRVDHQTKWLDAGSGFLSQHSKELIFGLGDSHSAKYVEIKWPSGVVQEFSNLDAGKSYLIVEGFADLENRQFRSPHPMPSQPVRANNEPRLHDTWFLEPLPLPEQQRGPGLLILLDGQHVPVHSRASTTMIDFSKESSDRRRKYEIFRRYLFDWRISLSTPLAFLLNDSGHAVKVYARMPSEQECKADLAQLLKLSPSAVLPFEGIYVGRPRRDFFKFGAAFLWSGYPEQALPYLEQVLRQSPRNARVLVLVGQIHLQAGRTDAAEKFFQGALEANERYAEAWSGLADVFESRNDLGKAIANYQKALTLKSDLLYTLLNAGRCADKLNQQQKAEEWYRRALRLDPQSPDAANGLGLALAKQGRAGEARQSFEQAITLRRDYSEAINNLGVLYLQEGKVNDAIAAFEYGIREAPDTDILYLNLGRTYTRLGKIDKARQVMQQLLDRKPDNVTAHRALQELNSR